AWGRADIVSSDSTRPKSWRRRFDIAAIGRIRSLLKWILWLCRRGRREKRPRRPALLTKGANRMASISTSASGLKTIQFVIANNRRRRIRLGKVPMKTAEEVCRRVEFLHVAKESGTAVDGDTAKWVASIGADLHAKLAAVGLVEARIGGNAWLKAFI